MVNAQEYINQHFPPKGRKNIVKLDLTNLDLEGFDKLYLMEGGVHLTEIHD